MSPFVAFLEGWRRVWRAPAVLFGTWLVWWGSSQLVAAALSTAEAAGAVLQRDAGGAGWLDAVRPWVEQLAYGFAPELTHFFSPEAIPPPVLAALALQGGLWLFVSGGILDRYARARPIRTGPFFAACGVFFFRFLRLAALVAALGAALWWATSSVRSSQMGDLLVLALIAGFGVVCDFAQARAVVEDRRSMIGALAASIRFVRRRPGRVILLAVLNGVALCAPPLAVLWMVPSLQFPLAQTARWTAAALLFVHLLARLACLASEIAFFQGELAHAGYTAAPLPLWPDSPAVEGLENLKLRRSKFEV